jgi:very-short-patch-repair endonuclease
MAFDVPSVVGPDGWASWSNLTGQLNRSTVGVWTDAGKLVRLEKGVYATGGTAADWRIRVEAAVRSRRGVASHATALALWGLLPRTGGPVHVAVATGRSGRGSAGVILHRTRELDDAVRRVDGLPVTCVERAIVDTWGRPGDLGRPAVRAAAIDAVRRRMCTTRNLLWEVERRPQLAARAALLELVRLLADGCRSELEIWGCLHILRGPGMPKFVLQRPVQVRGERFILDAACEESMLAVEMDGAAWHGSRTQRERDIRRDALVATIGWQTLRFGFARATGAAGSCRKDILATHQARLRMLRGE